MAIGIILGAVFIILCIAAAAISFHCFGDENVAGGMAALLFAIGFAVAFFLVPFSFHTVDTGEIAVVKHLGEAKELRAAGTHYDFWITNSYQVYDAKVQSANIDTMTYSSDAQTMDVQLTLQYQIESDRVIEIARQYGSLDVLEDRLRSVAVEKTKAVLSAHKAMDIIANRAAMSPAVEQAIKNAIGDEYYVNVTTVVLTNIDFSDAFESAVEEKMIAEQNQLRSEYENKTKVAQAEAAANAKLIAAKAEAEANRLLEQSVTDRILRKLFIEKWNGVLPGFVSGDAVNTFLPISTGE